MPVRVLTWTAHGVVELGELPDRPPAALPTTPWFVEPTRDVGGATLRALIASVRAEAVPGLSLRGQTIAAELGELRELPALGALVLDDSDVDDRALATLALPLRRIYLARTAISDAGVARLAARQPALEVVDLEDCPVGDGAARALATMPALRAVNLSRTQLGDDGGAALGALTRLEIVDLGHTRVGARTVAALRPLALRELFLDHTRVGAELATLAGFAPGLARFDVSELAAYRPSDRDLAWLAAAPNLVEVGLSGSRVHDALVLAIAAQPHLRELRLASTPISARAIAAIARLRELEEIDLADTPVDDASAAALIALPHVRFVRLDDTPIGDAALRTVPGPALAELYLSRTRLGDAGTAMLDHTPELVGLGLGATAIGDATLARVARLHRLRTLVLSKTAASSAALAGLAGLTALERLYLDDARLDDAALAALAPLRRLRVLHVAGTRLAEPAIATLRGFTKLEELAIGNTDVGASVAVADAWPRLRVLSLLAVDLGDGALAAIAAHPALSVLDLSSTEVHDPTPLAALAQLHQLGLVAAPLSAAGERAVRQLAARGGRRRALSTPRRCHRARRDGAGQLGVSAYVTVPFVTIGCSLPAASTTTLSDSTGHTGIGCAVAGCATSGTNEVDRVAASLTMAPRVAPTNAYCTMPGGAGASAQVAAALRSRGASAVVAPAAVAVTSA